MSRGFQRPTMPFHPHQSVCVVHVSVTKLQNIHVYSKLLLSVLSSQRAKYLKGLSELLTPRCSGFLAWVPPWITIVLQPQLPLLPESQHLPPSPSLQRGWSLEMGHPGKRRDPPMGLHLCSQGSCPPSTTRGHRGFISLSGWWTCAGRMFASFSWFQLQKHLMATYCMQNHQKLPFIENLLFSVYVN